MAENVGGTETAPDHSCQPPSNNLPKVMQKEGHRSVKIVQLYLMIQNVLATFNSHAVSISHKQCIVQTLCSELGSHTQREKIQFLTSGRSLSCPC